MAKRTISRRDFIKGVAAGTMSIAGLGLLSACGGTPDAPGPSGGGAPNVSGSSGTGVPNTSVSSGSQAKGLYTPGTYTAKAEGYHGDVTVTMTFDENSITNVVVDASGETESVGGAAADKLAQQVMSAQSSVIDGVSGASRTSDAVRTAAADCIAQAGGSPAAVVPPTQTSAVVVGSNTDWLGAAPEIAEHEITETLDTEILVVGAGNAGLMTAARAAGAGAKVLVIEKGIGSMNERHWIGAVDSTFSRAANVEVDKDRLAEELCCYASHRCDERLIRLWINNSGAMIDWYGGIVKQYNPDVKVHMEWDVGKGSHGAYYVPAVMHNFQDDIPEHDYSQATSSYGLSSLTSYLQDHGGTVRYETILVKLEQNGTGRVTGVIAKTDGGYIRINASKGVALCCGGYAYNKQMLAALDPDAYLSTVGAAASALNTGDGIKAAMWIGAAMDPDATAMLFDRGTIAPDQLSDGNWEKAGHFHLGSQPWLKVNLRGERFCNESVPYDFILHAAFMEPGHLYNTIYDSAWVEQVKQFKQIGCARIEPSESGGKLQIFSWEAEMGLLGAMEKAGFVQRADTLEELAQKLNMPVDTFTATVKRYNELCAKGVDEDFGKEPYRLLPVQQAPFFGCRQGANLLCTLDGLRINTKMQVLDADSDPIEGLYAAGDCSGGFFAHNYPEYIVGVAVGRTLTEGFLLGEAMAAL